ncbi:MAG: PorP/SprF family type IX secretion system membrane protein [Chitinophagales bacterium]|jgi:type IX secretion system PorP/SprF family membrane protein|nr:PorP/SprF family type IX secretion system membrane protein [Chitinophagales bacterium]
MKNFFWGIIFFFSFNYIKAQDFHFSQFYNAPLLLNPALTGNFDGKFRAIANHRMQWDGIVAGALYQTSSVSADFRLASWNSNFGIAIVNDMSNNNIYNVLEAALSYSYTLKFNRGVTFIGLQPVYRTTFVDINKLPEDIRQDPGLYTNATNFDLNLGLFQYHKQIWNSLNLYYGGSLNNLLTSEAYNEFGQQVKPRRYLAHAGGDFRLTDKIRAHITSMYVYQAKASQLLLGGYIASFPELRISDDFTINRVNFGLMLRINEFTPQSLIPKLTTDISNFQIGISYDYVVNSLGIGSMKPYTLELSLRYIFNPEEHREYECFNEIY